MTLDKRIGGWLGARLGTQRRGRPPGRQCRPCLDRLEGRELKDGGISLVAGTINIAGAASQNVVFITYNDPTHNIVNVSWNGTTTAFNHADVSGVHFVGQDGFNLLENFTDIATVAQGGNGFNDFQGASGHDTFIGGDGLNFFWVAGGHDTLVGGNGTNIFLGTGGNDSIQVGTGLNLIY
jgi:hypothetical protein